MWGAGENSYAAILKEERRPHRADCQAMLLVKQGGPREPWSASDAHHEEVRFKTNLGFDTSDLSF